MHLDAGCAGVTESGLGSDICRRRWVAVLNAAANAVVNKLALLAAVRRCAGRLGAAEGDSAVATRCILNLDAGCSGVAKAGGGSGGVEA